MIEITADELRQFVIDKMYSFESFSKDREPYAEVLKALDKREELQAENERLTGLYNLIVENETKLQIENVRLRKLLKKLRAYIKMRISNNHNSPEYRFGAERILDELDRLVEGNE